MSSSSVIYSKLTGNAMGPGYSTSHPLYQSRVNRGVNFLSLILLIHKSSSSPASLCHSAGSQEQIWISWYKPWCGKHLQVGDQGLLEYWDSTGLFFWPGVECRPRASYPVTTVSRITGLLRWAAGFFIRPTRCSCVPCEGGPASPPTHLSGGALFFGAAWQTNS